MTSRAAGVYAGPTQANIHDELLFQSIAFLDKWWVYMWLSSAAVAFCVVADLWWTAVGAFGSLDFLPAVHNVMAQNGNLQFLADLTPTLYHFFIAAFHTKSAQ